LRVVGSPTWYGVAIAQMQAFLDATDRCPLREARDSTAIIRDGDKTSCIRVDDQPAGVSGPSPGGSS